MMEQLSLFFESWEFFKDAVYASVFAGVTLGFLGVYILLKRIVFLSASVAQVSSAGIAFSYLLAMWIYQHVGIDCHCAGQSGCHCHGVDEGFWVEVLQIFIHPLFFASIASLLAMILLSRYQSSHRGDNSSIIAFVYLFGASATLLIGTRILSEIQDIQQLLFGNAVLVSSNDMKILGVVCLILMGIHFIFFRGFILSSFFHERSRVAGLPVGKLEFVLLVTLAVALAVSTKILGALPVFAFSVLPAMGARLFCRNIMMLFGFSAFLGGLSAYLGYLLAFVYQFPVGASQAMVSLVLFLGIYGVRFLLRFILSFGKLKESKV